MNPGTELLDAAKLANVEIATPCGGKGTCGKCIVRIVSGEVDSNNTEILAEIEEKNAYFQTCRTKVLDTPVTINIPKQVEIKEGISTDGFIDASLIREELFPKSSQLDPLAFKLYAEVPEPQPEDGFSDVDRLTRSLQPECSKKEFVYSLSVIRSLADMLRDNHGKVTATLISLPEQYKVIDVEPGDSTSRQYGIAIDIGTTTVSVLLIDQSIDKIIAIRADYNAQIKCGLDIISRINYANRADRLEELRLLALKTMNKLINQVSDDSNVRSEEIINAVISG
ncbi:MAG: 2Fe-2S iron-sulfur cluster binding domain-containing protein, partial [Bacteroidales bacterium]|nr:2Fe-2S iron-sulfur cluster binding domain-containing protein [Bacteroidales bacterium]